MVDWFRHSAPYIHAHRGKTFVLMLPGEAVLHETFAHTVHDIALLNSLGVKLVLAVGARAQIDTALARVHMKPALHKGVRITDSTALPLVVEAASSVRTQVEALLSTGLVNSPMHGAQIRVTGGNFVTAKPIGVRDGVDFHHTGEVRRVDADAIRSALDHHAIVVLPCLGYSASGEIFNLAIENIATHVAQALDADKLIAFIATPGLLDKQGQLQRELKPAQATALLKKHAIDHELSALRAAVNFIDHSTAENHKARAHLISYSKNGSLLEELFTREGSGTLIAHDSAELIRAATLDDVGGILELIQPLEAEGVLVRRSREVLEAEISNFTVIEHEGLIAACSALYTYPDSKMAEVACVATHPHYRGGGRASLLLDHLEKLAKKRGLKKLFVLTTQTAHWFVEKGFVHAKIDQLPNKKQQLYNYQRNSRIFIKPI
ncbi:MAG TPA: amino-acid N-acetyltransferase [Pseudomonadales bacterium]|nr:amino-acid N-acetyltransferase [Pseudomonadales bacterium]